MFQCSEHDPVGWFGLPRKTISDFCRNLEDLALLEAVLSCHARILADNVLSPGASGSQRSLSHVFFVLAAGCIDTSQSKREMDNFQQGVGTSSD